MAIQDMLANISDRISGVATVNTVFGEPRVQNGRAIVPVAMVIGGFGAGGGEGKMPPKEEGQSVQEGSGGGGGGWFALRPLAVLEVTDQQTRLIPILDMTKIILAGLGIIGGGMLVCAKMRGRSNHHRWR